MSVCLTSPWLVLFPGSLCWPPPFPWKTWDTGQTGSLKCYSFTFTSLETVSHLENYINQDAFVYLVSLTLCFCQSPSPAGSLVLLALPFWPETDCIHTGTLSHQLSFRHTVTHLLLADNKEQVTILITARLFKLKLLSKVNTTPHDFL